MTALPTGTVTFLFTDVERSTELVQALGDGYRRALEQHQEVVRGAVDAAGGTVVDTRGEEFFAAFGRAADAVSAAAAIQSAHVGHPFRTRVGLHTGEPALVGDGYLGLDVHRAARICAAGHGGQILLSQTTRQLVPAEDARDLGEHRLKGIARPERIFQLVPAGLTADFPPLVTDGDVPRPRLRRLAERLGRRTPPALEEVGWRVRGRMPRSAAVLRAELAQLGGVLFAASRLSADARRWLATTDRRRLARAVEEYEDLATVSPRAAEILAAARRRVRAFDAVAERVAALQASAADPRAEGGAEEVAALRRDVTRATDALDAALADAHARVGTAGVRLRRTLRRGIYRSGAAFVVPHVDEVGVEHFAEFATAEEAAAFRRVLGLQRRARRDLGDPPAPTFAMGSRDRARIFRRAPGDDNRAPP